jgi:hypothetical protein
MIAKLVIYTCRACESQNIVKNGHNASGSQQYWCKDCGKRGVLEPKRGYTEAQKEQILAAYNERPSESRIREASAVNGVETLVVACPKDVTMYQDAVKTAGYEDKLHIKDLVELVYEAL